MAQVIFGVDVAKGWIDAQRRGGKPERIAMEEAALCGFAERAAREGAKVVFEATGGYDRPLAAALAAAGRRISGSTRRSRGSSPAPSG